MKKNAIEPQHYFFPSNFTLHLQGTNRKTPWWKERTLESMINKILISLHLEQVDDGSN